jgi:hypothetical protein
VNNEVEIIIARKKPDSLKFLRNKIIISMAGTIKTTTEAYLVAMADAEKNVKARKYLFKSSLLYFSK